MIFGNMFPFKKRSKPVESLRASGETWKKAAPEEQWKVAEQELQMLRQGHIPDVYEAAGQALKRIPGTDKLTLLEVGCGCGYYSEVIPELAGDRFSYVGADYSEAMLAFAGTKYPEVRFLKVDITQIDFPDNSFDVVLSGAVIKHVPEWRKAIQELARVAGKYLILHRTTMTTGPTARHEEISYGAPVFFQEFKTKEFFNILRDCKYTLLFETQVYPDQKGSLREMTFLLQKEPTKS